jgi:hypothetical protein
MDLLDPKQVLAYLRILEKVYLFGRLHHFHCPEAGQWKGPATGEAGRSLPGQRSSRWAGLPALLPSASSAAQAIPLRVSGRETSVLLAGKRQRKRTKSISRPLEDSLEAPRTLRRTNQSPLSRDWTMEKLPHVLRRVLAIHNPVDTFLK